MIEFIVIGICIGILIEYFSWIYRCHKRNLFDKEGILINLKKEKEVKTT